MNLINNMTAHQVATTKRDILEAGASYNVKVDTYQPTTPYRTSLKFNGLANGKVDDWHTAGSFEDLQVAIAVSYLLCRAFFGAKAIKPDFDREYVLAHPEYLNWLSDWRYSDIYDRAIGKLPSYAKESRITTPPKARRAFYPNIYSALATA